MPKANQAGPVVAAFYAPWEDGGLSSFLAHVQLFDAGVEPGAAVEVIVVGGGRAYVDDEVRAFGVLVPASFVCAVNDLARDIIHELLPQPVSGFFVDLAECHPLA